MKRLYQIFNFIAKHPLAGKHKMLSIYKFLSWQISQLIFPGMRAVSFVGNTKLYMRKGLTGATGNLYLGLHEFNDMAFLLHFLRSEDLFADAGSNIGSYTVLASGHIGARTIAFEPVPATFELLVKNIHHNNITSLVSAYNCGVGSKNDWLYFTSSNDTVNHVVNDSTSNTVKVEVNSLDFFSEKHGVPSLIKIDVEGYETEVINGMMRLTQQQELKAIIIELNGSGYRYGFDERMIHDKLLTAGFKAFAYDAFERMLIAVEKYGTHNTIYIRDAEFVKMRLKTADKIRLFGESF
jgi:FkbM family methyltransferase